MSHPAPLAVAVDGLQARSPALPASPLGRPSSIAAMTDLPAGSAGVNSDVASSQTEAVEETPRDPSSPKQSQQSDAHDASIPLTVSNSQESHVTSSSVHAMTPPASDISSVTDGGVAGYLGHETSSASIRPGCEGADKNDHLLQLSTIAAAQDRISIGTAAGASRKRMADGEVKAGLGSMSMSPARGRGHGHARNLSTVSITSTGSTIGESQLSAELKTRLSYAMVKVNFGWQGHSIEEVESMAASQAVSPVSGSSTVRRHSSSASPRLDVTAASAQVHLAQQAAIRRKSDSPNLLSNKPSLAPPASIQPSISAARSNPRRNSSPRYTPTMLSHSHSASPHTPGQPMVVDSHQSLSQPARIADPILFPSHQNVREQDAMEALLFMSSPNNSANLKHTFSPTASPNPQVGGAFRSVAGRHALPSAPRKGLPGHRPPANLHRRTAFDKSPGVMHPPGSPMDVDSPQHSYYSPNGATPKRRVKGTNSHLRGALSLPTGLGAGHTSARRVLRDEDIERMLDRASAEAAESSDDEEIQIPRLRNDVAGMMGVRG
ncbi:cyclin-dependent kinase [Trichoderma arundinaceum]|uniref:Cyclin-dependent kinase n=1 Tax=Trichoderma arundinaceum TaxID=490622 RepID=A0A395P121_TRIAR|nr:cyclin-dependent kinase [Trichoderma arundinaceum]